MHAIQIQSDVERTLLWQPSSDPVCGTGEVLVDVHATALNRADLFQRAGKYPPPPGASKILGLEIAGEVSVLGENVEGCKLGDRVCALLAGGGYAERAAVPAEMLMPVPEGWDFEQAAAVPECFLTGFVNFYMEAGLQRGETVLTHGGASGVGTAAIQLACASGNSIFVTAGSAEKVARCEELGAELAINYREHDFVESVLAYTEGAGVDVIMDIVGGDYLHRNLKLLKPKGRLVIISTLGGAHTEIDLGVLMRRRACIIGSVLRGRSLAEKIEIKQRFMQRFWSLFLEGRLRPVIDSVFPIEQAVAAHLRMAENRNVGKIVLKVR
ncbi:MAG: NAD(P)H-quinone oxidoreductase [Anaerolineales bacterium]|nr:NAD(P)H-quinone oxidoreductase [Anaerolineales bacterium]